MTSVDSYTSYASYASSWRTALDSARSSLSSRIARLRELEVEVSRKAATLNRLNGNSMFSSSIIVVGVCAMGKKSTCKPMREILGRLPSNEFEFKIFEERVILEDPIETWPICDCLIAFYSTGFPQNKVEQYVKLRKPVCVNDLEAQRLLWDRRTVYKICNENDIPVPEHVVVNREDGQDDMIETDNYVEVAGKRIYKPFVEKPVDADCHDVFIYYPGTSGGGRKELFRKIGDRSSEFYPDRNHVRRDGSYIYEEFLTTEGTDVKVYAVTMEYAHAEARKSPVMDGRVIRDENNVEVRYPVILTNQEKDLARKVVKVFKQNVCGFDMLRSGGKSYVCDVNGWSFVKRSARYHKDSAMMLARLIRNLMGREGPPSVIETDTESEDEEEEEGVNSFHGHPSEKGKDKPLKKRHEELRAVIAIIRHGDRTPKQKLKMYVTDDRFLKLFKDIPPKAPLPSSSPKANKSTSNEPEWPELKLKTAKELGNILKITNELLTERGKANPPGTIPEDEEDSNTQSDSITDALTQVRAVLEMHGTFRGINRKVQLRVTKTSPETRMPIEAQLILKWGGTLTPQGRERAEQMGRSFRERMYPGVDGLIRLHSTYRHDLKIYASDEGRVQVTAAAFAKGLLDLEGHLTPILESLVKKGADINLLLHDASQATANALKAKSKLKDLLTNPQDTRKTVLPASVERALKSLGVEGPLVAMKKLHEEICLLVEQLKFHLKNSKKFDSLPKIPERGSIAATAFRRGRTASITESSIFVEASALSSSPRLSSGNMEIGGAAASLGVTIDLDSNSEKIDRGDGAVSVRDLFVLACARWEKLQADFFRKDNFDISKIPDIYDCAKYDITHNPEFLKLQPFHLLGIFQLSKHLADAVVPQEYGETPLDKFEIGIKTCSSLLGKIREDLRVAAEEGAPVDCKIRESSKDSPDIDDSRSEVNDDLSTMSGGVTLNETTAYRLDRKLAKSMGIKNANRHVRTRLYFTSESHLHAVMNVIRYAHIVNPNLPKPSEAVLKRLLDIDELSYLCHIVLRLYEVTEPDGTKHHSLRIYVSDGISANVEVVDEEIKVKVGTDSEPMKDLDSPRMIGSTLQPSGVGFSSFVAKASNESNDSPLLTTQSGKPRSFIRHVVKHLPPANPMVALWHHLTLNEGMRLFDSGLVEILELVPNRAQRHPKVPLHRFHSTHLPNQLPSWSKDEDEEIDPEDLRIA